MPPGASGWPTPLNVANTLKGGDCVQQTKQRVIVGAVVTRHVAPRTAWPSLLRPTPPPLDASRWAQSASGSHAADHWLRSLPTRLVSAQETDRGQPKPSWTLADTQHEVSNGTPLPRSRWGASLTRLDCGASGPGEPTTPSPRRGSGRNGRSLSVARWLGRYHRWSGVIPETGPFWMPPRETRGWPLQLRRSALAAPPSTSTTGNRDPERTTARSLGYWKRASFPSTNFLPAPQRRSETSFTSSLIEFPVFSELPNPQRTTGSVRNTGPVG